MRSCKFAFSRLLCMQCGKLERGSHWRVAVRVHNNPLNKKKIVPGCFAGSGCVCILYVCTESVLLVSRNLSVPTRQRESAVDPAVSGAKVSKVSRPMWHNTNVRI